MGLPSVQQDEERRGRAQNLLAPIVVLVWQVRWLFHQPVGQGEVQCGAVRFTQESGTSLAAQVGRNAVLCGSKGGGFRWRNPFVPRSGMGFHSLRIGSLSGCVECRVVASP